MKTALITGASSGIGEAFAKELASRQTNLVLVARSQEKLQRLSEQLREQFQIEADVIAQDLTAPGAVKFVYEAVSQKGLTVDLLINNAGVGDYGAFADRPLPRQLDIVTLNITALVEITGLFLPQMKQRGSGAVINLSSIAAFQPLPYQATYAATKAFILSFSEALWAENKQTGVRVLAVCPGPTETEFFDVAEYPGTYKQESDRNFTPPEEVAKEALKALESHQSTIVTGGLGNQVIVNLQRFLPRDLLVSGIEKQFRP